MGKKVTGSKGHYDRCLMVNYADACNEVKHHVRGIIDYYARLYRGSRHILLGIEHNASLGHTYLKFSGPFPEEEFTNTITHVSDKKKKGEQIRLEGVTVTALGIY
jgi:hypothetical protein